MDNKNVLIFDFDGTIADTFQYLIEIGNRLSKEFDFNRIEPDEVEDLKDKNVHETIRHLDIPFLKIPMIVAKAKKELHKEIESVKPIEGLKEILQQLKSLGFKMGILSSNSLKNVMGFLENNDLDLFDFIHSNSKIWSKNRCLKTLLTENRLKLSQAIYIGDETRDIIAAQKAGMRCAAVTWGYNSKKALQAHHPDYLIHDPQDLFQLVK
jgi:phosphoglycolate phosphatase